jgi:hypothetical protein
MVLEPRLKPDMIEEQAARLVSESSDEIKRKSASSSLWLDAMLSWHESLLVLLFSANHRERSSHCRSSMLSSLTDAWLLQLRVAWMPITPFWY